MPPNAVASFARFYSRIAIAHFVSYVGIGAASWVLIMRRCLPLVPAAAGVREFASSYVQFWLWPAQFLRALIIAAVLYPLRGTLARMGRAGGAFIAALMIGIGCLAGFNGLIEDLVFYWNVSLYLYWIHIPEILAQTLAFGYGLLWLERMADQGRVETLAAAISSPNARS